MESHTCIFETNTGVRYAVCLALDDKAKQIDAWIGAGMSEDKYLFIEHKIIKGTNTSPEVAEFLLRKFRRMLPEEKLIRRK